MTARAFVAATMVAATLGPIGAAAAEEEPKPAIARKQYPTKASGTDTAAFDVAGVRLGMTPDEAREALAAKAGSQNGFELRPFRDGAYLFHENRTTGHKTTVTFGLVPGGTKLQAERVQLTIATTSARQLKPDPKRQAELEAAALKKYGPATLTDRGSFGTSYDWCPQLWNTSGGAWTCNHHQPGVRVSLSALGMVEMTDTRFGQERDEFFRKVRASGPL